MTPWRLYRNICAGVNHRNKMNAKLDIVMSGKMADKLTIDGKTVKQRVIEKFPELDIKWEMT